MDSTFVLLFRRSRSKAEPVALDDAASTLGPFANSLRADGRLVDAYVAADPLGLRGQETQRRDVALLAGSESESTHDLDMYGTDAAMGIFGSFVLTAPTYAEATTIARTCPIVREGWELELRLAGDVEPPDLPYLEFEAPES